MSSTNKTTNLHLSQFVSEDKPAWLGDYNQDMAKVDEAVKANETEITSAKATIATQGASISANTSAIEALQTATGEYTSKFERIDGDITNLVAETGSAKTLAETANNKADTNAGLIAGQATELIDVKNDVQSNTTEIAGAKEDIQGINAQITSLASEIFPSQFETITSIAGLDTNNVNITLAQTPHSTSFKVYGELDIFHGSGSYTYTKTAVKGLEGRYGIKTTLKLNEAPETSYEIFPAGLMVPYTPGASVGDSFVGAFPRGIAIDTDGFVYLNVSSEAQETVPTWQRARLTIFPALYVNKNFGDITPEEQ